MKKFISNYAWSLLVAVLLNTVSYGAEPLNYGIKVGGSSGVMTDLSKAKKALGSDAEASLISLGFVGGLFVEYAFHDMVGACLDANFAAGSQGKISAKGKSDQTYKISANRVNVNLGPVIYPMGIEDENGILRVNVGFNVAFPVGSASGQKNEEKAVDIKSDNLTSFGMGVGAGVGYEFPMGFLVELGGLYEFTPFFKEDSSFKRQNLGLGKDTANNLINARLSLGYNIASAFED